jgi:hypothetical protein
VLNLLVCVAAEYSVASSVNVTIRGIKLKTSGPGLLSFLATFMALFVSQSRAGEQTGEMRVEGRPVAAWVADVDIDGTMHNPGEPDLPLDTLASAGPKILKPLTGILSNDASRTQRAKAAYVISVIAHRNREGLDYSETVSALVSAAEHSNVRVRQYSIQALGSMGRAVSNAIPVLIRSTHDDDSSVRMCAAEALKRIGIATPEAVEALNRALSDPDGSVQITAVQALYDLGKPATNAVPVLIQLTRNKDVGVRCSAVQTLGEKGTNSPEIVEALKQALNDEAEKFVPPLAREALKKIEARDRSR